MDDRTKTYFEWIRRGARGNIEYTLTTSEGDEFLRAVDDKGNTILLAALAYRYEQMAKDFADALSAVCPELLNAKNKMAGWVGGRTGGWRHENGWMPDGGWSAFSYALISGLLDAFGHLCKTKGVDPNIKVHGTPVICDAVIHGGSLFDAECALKHLLAMPGIDVFATDEQCESKTCIDLAKELKKYRLLQILEEHVKATGETVDAQKLTKRPVAPKVSKPKSKKHTI